MTTKREQYKELMNIIIDEYLNTPEKERSLTKLGEKYGVKRQTISKYLKEKDIEVVNYQNRCRIDSSVFDVIDTEEKAYWLGFIYADGNISSEGHRFEINLSAKDLDHMIKLKTFLKLETDIRVETNRGNGYEICRLSVRNENLWNQLNNKGCTPKKSLTLVFPDLDIFSNKKLIYHFIRGYCDGDGSLGSYQLKESNTKTTQIGFVGTLEFLKSLQTLLNEKGYLRNKSYGDVINKAFSLTYSGSIARKIARLLYENSSIYLERKYNIYKLFCQLEEESSRRKSTKIGEPCDGNTEVN